MTTLQHAHVVVLSRCARTLVNFRLALMLSIQAQGAEVKCMGAAEDGFPKILSENGVKFRSLPISRRGMDPMSDLWLLLRYFREFRAAKPDVVHAFTIKPVVYGTIGAWLAGVPVRIVTITGLGHVFISAHGFIRRLVSLMYRFALRHAHLIFFQNADDFDLFVREGLVEASRGRLIAGSGVDTERFSLVDLPSASGASTSFLMIGRLLAEKGIHEFIAAAKRVRQKYPGISMTVLGGFDPRNPSSLDAASLACLLGDEIEWIDEVADIRPYMAAADVIVLPSYREGMPRVILEAAAMGRAVIVTDVPGCRQSVVPEKTGLLVPAKSVEALAQAMERLILDPGLVQQLGSAGRRFVEDKFDERKVIAEIIDSYQELLAKGP